MSLCQTAGFGEHLRLEGTSGCASTSTSCSQQDQPTSDQLEFCPVKFWNFSLQKCYNFSGQTVSVGKIIFLTLIVTQAFFKNMPCWAITAAFQSQTGSWMLWAHKPALWATPPDAFIIYHHQLNEMEMKFLHLTIQWSFTITYTRRSADHIIHSLHFYSHNDLLELAMPLVLVTLYWIVAPGLSAVIAKASSSHSSQVAHSLWQRLFWCFPLTPQILT